MAIALEFIDLVIPIANIDRVYPGGFTQFKADRRGRLNSVIWHDKYLFRTGTMGPEDMAPMIDEWVERGLLPFKEVDGRKNWNELCVVEALFGGPTLPCQWLQIDLTTMSGYLTGTEPGDIAAHDSWSYDGES